PSRWGSTSAATRAPGDERASVEGDEEARRERARPEPPSERTSNASEPERPTANQQEREAMSLTAADLDHLVSRLQGVLRSDQVLTSKADRFNRARTPAPFPVHRWSEHVPDVVVLPESTEDVVAVVRLANDLGVPIVPRDGGTGLTDGAVPLRHGILVDVKRMNHIHEIDLENRTCTVGVGINMLKLNEVLGRHGLILPDTPASSPCSLVGGRIGTSGWSLIGSRYGHTRDLVLSFDHVLPTGEVMHVGGGIGGEHTPPRSGYP